MKREIKSIFKSKTNLLSDDREMTAQQAENGWKAYVQLFSLMSPEDKSHVVAVDCYRTMQIYLDELYNEISMQFGEGELLQTIHTMIRKALMEASKNPSSVESDIYKNIQCLVFDYPERVPNLVAAINREVNRNHDE